MHKKIEEEIAIYSYVGCLKTFVFVTSVTYSITVYMWTLG